MPKAMRHLQEELGILDTPLIAYNGGLLLDGEKVMSSTEIANHVLEDAIKLCENTTIHLSLYNNDHWYVPSMDYWAKREAHNTQVTPLVQPVSKTLSQWNHKNKGAHKIMAMGDENEIELLYNTLEEQYSSEINLYRSKTTYIEIAHKSISKETAINELLTQNYQHITPKDIIAFGDNYNDIQMLKAVGMGVAVQNAKPEVLEIANAITAKNIEDGVAIAIKEFIE